VRPIPSSPRQTRAAWRGQRRNHSIKVNVMCKRMALSSLVLLAFLGIAPLLGACHTVAGAGQDVSKTGQVITKTANQATP
jgi:predicted small secreted protein